MSIRASGLCFAALTALGGCSAGGGAPSDAKPTGATNDAGSGAGVSGQSDGGAVASNGQLSVSLQNSGRHGDALLITVQGSDPAGQTTEAHVKLLDATNAPVIAFDTNWDGAPDSAEKRLHFDASTLGQKTFRQTITLPGLYASPSVASAVVALSDANGNLSSPVTATLHPQAVRHQGEACDTTSVADRCTDGLSCTGKPATCQVAAPPSLTRVGYFGGDNPAQLFLGADPAEDLASLQVNFLDANGKSLVVDLSGDGAGDPASSVLLDARGSLGQTFFFENDPSSTFAASVPKISVIATDASGKSGSPVVATLANLPVVPSGQACDPYGFSLCAVGTVCSPGIAGTTNRCTALPTLQGSKCAAAPETAGGVLAGWGAVSGASVWDPPAGCALGTAVNHPESVVSLKLTHAVGTLTVSTAVPETDFDTILYVLPDCAASPSQALGCNDDAEGYASTVTLQNVPAGTYAVVVDSATARTGHFGLTVTSQ